MPLAELPSSIAFLIGAARGTINPATCNAGLQLAPERSSTLAALRTASMQIGAIATVSVVTAILSRVGDPGDAQAWVYLTLGVLFTVELPLLAPVPEHRGAW